MNRLLEYCKGDKVYTMERLTTRNIAGVAVYKHPFECEICGETIWRLPDYGNGSPTEKLADYEDAEEQGLLLRLPCKVGDTVYAPTRNFVSELRIILISIERDNVFFYWILNTGIYPNLNGFTASDIGKTVFFTYEEAEGKLAEMEGAE